MRPTLNCCIAAQIVFPWAHANGHLDDAEFLRLMATVRYNTWVAQRCGGKDEFDDYTLADKVAKRQKNRDRDCYAYSCPTCHKFHIGTRQRDGGRVEKDRRFRRRRQLDRMQEELGDA